MHHAKIFVQKYVAVKREGSRSRWIAKIHTQLDAVVRPLALPKRNFNGVTQISILRRLAIHFNHAEMDLMGVKRMRLQRPIFYRPILDRSDFGRNDGLLVGLKYLLLLPVNRDIELDRPVSSPNSSEK